MPHTNRRQDPRLQVGRDVLIRNLTGDGRTASAVIENVSRGGCLISTNERLALDDAVQLSIDDAIYLGEVVHTRDKDGTWFTGIRFDHRLSEFELQQIASRYFARLPRH